MPETNDPASTPNPFDEGYFHSGPYERVSFGKYSQYWWSNRYYAILARKYGPETGRVLEIGCGLGHLLGWLCDDYQVVGTDINQWAIEQARENVPKGTFYVQPAEDLGIFPQAAFQIVIAKHVVEHLEKPILAIREISRVLAPGGLLLLATPNMDSPMRAWKKENWIGYQDPTHISLKTPAEWGEMLSKHDIAITKVFSDGFWDAPYLPWLPAKLQKVIFGAPGGLQAILGWSIIPLRMGESMIVLAKRR